MVHTGQKIQRAILFLFSSLEGGKVVNDSVGPHLTLPSFLQADPVPLVPLCLQEPVKRSFCILEL